MKRLITVLILAVVCGAQTPTIKSGDIASSGVFLNTTPTPRIMIGGSQIIQVEDKDGNLMVHVDNDGKVTYGEHYKADESARTFWETLAKYYPSVCVPPAKVPSKEVHK